jgi:hypothetical protein
VSPERIERLVDEAQEKLGCSLMWSPSSSWTPLAISFRQFDNDLFTEARRETDIRARSPVLRMMNREEFHQARSAVMLTLRERLST